MKPTFSSSKLAQLSPWEISVRREEYRWDFSFGTIMLVGAVMISINAIISKNGVVVSAIEIVAALFYTVLMTIFFYRGFLKKETLEAQLRLQRRRERSKRLLDELCYDRETKFHPEDVGAPHFQDSNGFSI